MVPGGHDKRTATQMEAKPCPVPIIGVHDQAANSRRSTE